MFRILIVEDNAVFRKMIKEILQSNFPSLDISEAETGENALQSVQSMLPHLIFMDIRLPDVNGLEITRKIKTRYPDTVVAIYTNYDLPEYREAAKQAEADYFLSKGSTPGQELVKLVESILSDRQTIPGK
jgi:CheY-like chemotaxis protein